MTTQDIFLAMFERYFESRGFKELELSEYQLLKAFYLQGATDALKMVIERKEAEKKEELLSNKRRG